MKKLVFCFDGTCNSPDTFDDYLENISITNILKLHILYGGSLTSRKQDPAESGIAPHSYYYRGIGTRGNWFQRKFNALFAPPYGDMEDIIAAALNDLEKYEDVKKEIFIFGFSRGAAIARMFASRLGEIGEKVRFLGVFDTVASTRGSLDLNSDTYPASGILFENGTIGDHIEGAVHLVALDEKRILFQPTLINKREGVKEVWFAGVHSDVGGGYWYDGLSDVALDFMLHEAKNAGLRALTLDKINWDKLKASGAEDYICEDDISINPLPKGNAHLQNMGTTIGGKVRLTARFPRVNDNDQPIPNGGPLLHYTVAERFEALAGYRPHALRDKEYRILQKNGAPSRSYKGISGLREFNDEQRTAAQNP